MFADTRGTSTLETALMLPVLLFLTLGIFAFTHVTFLKVAATEAAREASRAAAVTYDVPGKDWRAQAQVKAGDVLRTVGVNPATADVKVSVSGDSQSPRAGGRGVGHAAGRRGRSVRGPLFEVGGWREAGASLVYRSKIISIILE
ncbi:MAG: pilus assembly protein [Clostridia bacterium]|nr:MAG: pilus assembly protein [Clostridia bacterium]